MMSSIRRLSKSTVGTIVMALFLLAIVASFALGDIQNVTSGAGFGLSSDTLAKAGGEKITDADLSKAMEQRLSQVRQQNPEADYAALAADFDPLLGELIDARTLQAFAKETGFQLSKRLVDAEIATIPGARGLDGKFSDQAYQAFLAQSRLTDQDVRALISASLLQRLLLTPVATSAKVPVGMARPYAAMLLEARQGDVATVPIAAFRAGLTPTPADIQSFYTANRARYMVPEQRVLRLARIGPEQVAGVTPTDAEIAAFYQANQATYAAKDIRSLSQAVVPDQAVANAIAQRARAGATLAAAAAPAGLAAADVAVGAQTRAQFAGLAGDAVADAAFAAASGAVVGPLQSELGWHVVKVDSVRQDAGKSLAAARGEIAARLTLEKRKNALTDLVAAVEDSIADGANFSEAAAKAKLAAIETPPITAAGASLADPAFRLPADLVPVIKGGFDIEPTDEPVVETLPGEAGYVLVAPSRVIQAAPAPLAGIRDRVANDWIGQQANARARALAASIAAKANAGTPLADAVRDAGTALPALRPVAARRIDLTQMGGKVPPPIQMLFSLGSGKSRMVAGGNGNFYVVKVNRIVPGNALTQPGLISSVQREFEQPLSQEYADQFLAALRKEVGVSRNEAAIAAARTRIVGGGN
ncbi:peptidylprolyl isomerase [Sphingomonas sp.]|uniref:peptidylprolyl isomerase n=1 Tax=Sphingomonas sp. TaxID=28214 RepID=UPI00286DE537|nr:peptidylprolyl isomerase [Sphingomonas sp.]